jgi:hypothetical protein
MKSQIGGRIRRHWAGNPCANSSSQEQGLEGRKRIFALQLFSTVACQPLPLRRQPELSQELLRERISNGQLLSAGASTGTVALPPIWLNFCFVSCSTTSMAFFMQAAPQVTVFQA